MSDADVLVLSTLEDIRYSIVLIMRRFETIHHYDDFLVDEVGLEKLDSISMRLVAIGEGFKHIDKLTDKQLLTRYPEINWKGVKGVRDILTHHYFDLDAETIFMICQDKLNELLRVTDAMIVETKSKLNHQKGVMDE